MKNDDGVIVVSCYNNKRDGGGLYVVKNDKLIPIFEGTNCHGLYYDSEMEILFCVTRIKPQILCFKFDKNTQSFVKLSTDFENYIFGDNAHGICVHNKKLLVVATNGDGDAESWNAAEPDKMIYKPGKIIKSDIYINMNQVIIKNSLMINPFSCTHHHHINDICNVGSNLYLSSFSYCDKNKNDIAKGAISTLNVDYGADFFMDGFKKPHSVSYLKGKLYIASSADSSVLSIDPINKTSFLEYKGPDVYVKGLLVTDNNLYVGLNFSLGRTESKFTNDTKGILKVDRKTGEAIKISLPPQSDNVYSIILI